MCWGGWPGLTIAPTLEGAPSKLRLGGGFPRGMHSWKTSEARPDSRCSLRFDLDRTRCGRDIAAGRSARGNLYMRRGRPVDQDEHGEEEDSEDGENAARSRQERHRRRTRRKRNRPSSPGGARLRTPAREIGAPGSRPPLGR